MTIRDIAKESDVSITTVIKKNRYTAGRKVKTEIMLNKSTTKKIALIIPEISQMFFSAVIDEIEKQCAENQFDLILHCSRNDIEKEKRYVMNLIESDVDGILYMSTSTCNENYFEELKKADKKFVVLDNDFTNYNLPGAVFVDGETGIYEMTKYLLNNGHRDIAYFSGVRHCKFNNKRHQGYTRALLEQNIAVDPSLTVFGDFTFSSGAECVDKLMTQKQRVTAIICENDLIAYGTISQLKTYGLMVPEHISVTGFDNMSIGEMMYPALTTVDQHIELIVKKAMELLNKMNQEKEMDTKIEKIIPDIIYRDSVRCILEHETMA